MKAFVALTLLAVVGTATALQCFNCNSEIDSACNDDFKFDSPALQGAFIETCKEENEVTPFCRKSKSYIERIHNMTETRVQRDCGYMRREGYLCYQKRSEDYIMDTCQCDSDLCNGAPALTTSVASILAVVVPIFTRFL